MEKLGFFTNFWGFFSLIFWQHCTLAIFEIIRFSVFILTGSIFCKTGKMISPMSLVRARVVLNASRQITTSAARSEVHPGYLKIKERQKAFQVNNGLRVSSKNILSEVHFSFFTSSCINICNYIQLLY